MSTLEEQTKHLQPEFDASGAKVAELRGYLLQHDVPFHATAKKADLVSLFNAHVKANATQLLNEQYNGKPKRKRSITDMRTSQTISDLATVAEPKTPGIRRSATSSTISKSAARKSTGSRIAKSREPSVGAEVATDADAEDAEAVPVKRPRGRPRKSVASPVPAPVKHIDVTDAPPVPAIPSAHKPVVSRKRKSTPLEGNENTEPVADTNGKAKSARRKSSRPTTLDEEAEASGFSDFNPFQSGEDTSPESSNKKRRKSSIGPVATGRKSLLGIKESAKKPRPSLPASFMSPRPTEPETPAPPMPKRAALPTQTPARSARATRSTSNFQPSTAPLADIQIAPESFKLSPRKPSVPSVSSIFRQPSAEQISPELDEIPESPAAHDEPLVRRRRASDRDEKPSSPTREVQQKSSLSTKSRFPAPIKSPVTPAAKRPNLIVKKANGTIIKYPARHSKSAAAASALATLLPLLLLLYSAWFVQEKKSIGYCDTGSRSNGNQASIPLGNYLHSNLPDLGDKLVALTPEGQRTHAQSIIDTVSSTFSKSEDILTPRCIPCPQHAQCENGELQSCEHDYVLRPSTLSLNGLLPVPASCEPDTEKLRRVAETAAIIDRWLRHLKGNIICDKNEWRKERKGTGERDLMVYGAREDDVKKMVEVAGRPTKISDQAWDDIFTLAVRELISHGEVIHGLDNDAEAWLAAVNADMPASCRGKLALYEAADRHKTSLGGLFMTLLSMLYGRYKLGQRREIKKLADELVPEALNQLQQQEQSHRIGEALYPHLSPSHLRDVLMSHHYSPSFRKATWDRVERIIENNSNVRVRQAEHEGEDLRVWQWIGVSSSPAKRVGEAPESSMKGKHITWSDEPASAAGTPSLPRF